MDQRLKKVERILIVQRRLHQIAEWKLAGIDRERAELQSGRESLVEALNQDRQIHGLFVEAMARRLKALAIETDRVNRERALQEKRLLEEGLRLKRTERMTEKVKRELVKSLWKRGFDDLLDTLGRKDGASLP